MKITFLGTGAADFLPSLSDKNRYTLSKDIRRCTVTLLDENTLIDCGPHILDEIEIHHIDPTLIENILLTHNHSDHFDSDMLKSLQSLCGHKLNIWYNEEIELPSIENIIYHPMKIKSSYKVGLFDVTALKANHIEGAVHYSIEKNGKKIFYGCDGAWLLMDTYSYMRNKQYDVMIMDATVGDYDGDYRMAEHNSLPMIRMMVKSFETVGIINKNTKIILDHLARTLHKDYETTCHIAKADGFVVAYDGMIIYI